jgi:hypothetical protein
MHQDRVCVGARYHAIARNPASHGWLIPGSRLAVYECANVGSILLGNKALQ